MGKNYLQCWPGHNNPACPAQDCKERLAAARKRLISAVLQAVQWASGGDGPVSSPGGLDTELLTGTVHRGGGGSCRHLLVQSWLVSRLGQTGCGPGWGGQGGGSPVSVCPLGRLPELKGPFSVFFCSY